MSTFSKGFTQGLGDIKFNGAGLGKALGQNIGVVSSAVGGLAGGLIGDGYQDEIGSIMGQAGQLASAIPGPWGAAISGGLQVLGGLTNRAFGTKVNQEALNAANQGTNYLNSFVSNASSFDDLRGPQTVEAVQDAYKGGWFSGSKARRKNEELRRKRALAQDLADRSVENNLDNLVYDQMGNLLANYAALGGPLHTQGADWSNGITVVGAGGTHENNPLEGVPMGIAPDGTPNLVEEGEVIYNDYVFSNRLKVPEAVKKKYKLKGRKKMTFADAAKKAQKESEERPNDPISKRGLEDIMSKLMGEQESIRQRRESKRNRFSLGGRKYKNGSQMIDMSTVSFPSLTFDEIKPLDIPRITMPKETVDLINRGVQISEPKPIERTRYNPLTALRYIPAIGAGIGVFSDLMGWTNKPDYSSADALIKTADNVGDVRFNPIGNYLRYTPLDRLFYANQLAADAAGARRTIVNNSGGNRGTAIAGILASDYNAQKSLGDLYRQAEEYNQAQRERAETFNRDTNKFNSEGFLRAQIANKENDKLKLDAAARAAALRDAVDSRVDAARSANLTNLFDSLGNIGREAVMEGWINNNPGLRYNISLGGRGVTYGTSNANGGFLTITKRRRNK